MTLRRVTDRKNLDELNDMKKSALVLTDTKQLFNLMCTEFLLHIFKADINNASINHLCEY